MQLKSAILFTFFILISFSMHEEDAVIPIEGGGVYQIQFDYTDFEKKQYPGLISQQLKLSLEIAAKYFKTLLTQKSVTSNQIFATPENQKLCHPNLNSKLSNIKLRKYKAPRSQQNRIDLIIYILVDETLTHDGPRATSGICVFNTETGATQGAIFLNEFYLNVVDTDDGFQTMVQVAIHEILHIIAFNDLVITEQNTKNEYYNGRNIYVLATDHVIQYQQMHLSCNEQIGYPLEIENKQNGLHPGYHWDANFVGTHEIMSHQNYDPHKRIIRFVFTKIKMNKKQCGFTLAFLMDTKFFQDVKWQQNIEDLEFGRGMGCEFLSQTCAQYRNQLLQIDSNSKYYCDPSLSPTQQSCDQFDNFIAKCEIVTTNGDTTCGVWTGDSSKRCNDDGNNNHKCLVAKKYDGCEEIYGADCFIYSEFNLITNVIEWSKTSGQSAVCQYQQQWSTLYQNGYQVGEIQCLSKDNKIKGDYCPNHCNSAGICLKGQCYY